MKSALLFVIQRIGHLVGRMRKRVALSFALGAAVTAFVALAVSPGKYNLDGPPVHVMVDAISLCVGRRFIEPEDLKRWNESKKPVTAGHLYRRAVPIALFSEALEGYSDALYQGGIATTYDKRLYPPDWVRIQLLPKVSRRPVSVPPKDYMGAFVDDWVLDNGFRMHSRHPDCVGKSVVLGALSAVTLGPECLDTEIRYGHPTAPEVVLFCNPKRCYTSNYIVSGDVSFEYDFPRGYLTKWPSLHSGILGRVTDWRGDSACVP